MSLPFLVSRGHLYSVVCGPFPASLQPLASVVISPTIHSDLLPPSYKDSGNYIGPILVIQGTLPLSRFLI